MNGPIKEADIYVGTRWRDWQDEETKVKEQDEEAEIRVQDEGPLQWRDPM